MSEERTGGTTAPASRPRRLRLLLLLPLAAFVGLAGIFLQRLADGTDPSALPSMLIGRAAPDFALPPLEGVAGPGLSRQDLAGKLTLVNVFASWCAPCREEHPVLTALASDPRIRVVGINYKDRPEDARRFLAELGNPYSAIGADRNGRTAIDWGVYGVPETFLIGEDGTIRHRFAGALTAEGVRSIIMPAIEKSAGKS